MTTERAYWVAWPHIDGIGPILQKRLFMAFGSLAAAWKAPAEALLNVDGIGLLLADKIVALRSQLSPNSLLQTCEAQNQSFWTPADVDYPKQLFEIPDPPPLLFYRGPLRPNDAPTTWGQSLTVGIVGTRYPSPYGVRWTRRLSSRLTEQGMTIVSGMAKGVDTYAHESCLYRQGQTIAVLGTGVDVVYPITNQKLYEKLTTQGLILSEYADGTQPEKAHFPRRNRIIAGLSQAVLVTEAPQRSGALITAHLANDYGREVYALPSSLDNKNGQGCLALINQGSQLILSESSLVESLTQLAQAQSPLPERQGAINSPPVTELDTLNGPFKDLGEPGSNADQPHPLNQTLEPARTTSLPLSLDASLEKIFQAISADPITLDNLVRQTQQDTGTLLSSLMQLELLGLVTQLPGMQYQRSSS